MLGKCQTAKAKGLGSSYDLVCSFCISTRNGTKLLRAIFQTPLLVVTEYPNIWCNCDHHSFPLAWTTNENAECYCSTKQHFPRTQLCQGLPCSSSFRFVQVSVQGAIGWTEFAKLELKYVLIIIMWWSICLSEKNSRKLKTLLFKWMHENKSRKMLIFSPQVLGMGNINTKSLSISENFALIKIKWKIIWLEICINIFVNQEEPSLSSCFSFLYL